MTQRKPYQQPRIVGPLAITSVCWDCLRPLTLTPAGWLDDLNRLACSAYKPGDHEHSPSFQAVIDWPHHLSQT